MKSHSYHVSIYKHMEQMNIFCSFFSNTLPSEPLCLVAWFWSTQDRLCMNWVRSLLSMCSILLGYSFKPRPNSLALATGSLVMTIGLWINGYSQWKKNSLTKKKKIDWSRSLGCGDLKGLMQFRQSFLFSSFIKKTKLKEARRGLFDIKNWNINF